MMKLKKDPGSRIGVPGITINRSLYKYSKAIIEIDRKTTRATDWFLYKRYCSECIKNGIKEIPAVEKRLLTS